MSRVLNRYGFGRTNFIFGASALLLLLIIMPHVRAADMIRTSEPSPTCKLNAH